MRAVARPSAVRSRAVCALIVIGLAAAGLFSTSARAQSLDVSLAGGVAFPDRTLVLSVPPATPLTSERTHITENGHPVTGLTTTSIKRANVGDFGVMLLIDQSPSMSGTPEAQAIAAARTLAAGRSGNQELGAITFADTPTLLVPLTSDQSAIQKALGNTPRTAAGTHILPALALALQQLSRANVATGAVILVSDGADRESSAGITPRSIAADAAAAHVRIFTVGVRDRYYTPQSMHMLAQIGGGVFTEASASQLAGTLTSIQSGLVSRYVVHYRSAQPLGHKVALSVRVDGVPGTFNTHYTSPAPPPAPRDGGRNAQHQSFWTSTLAIVLVGLACALLLAIIATVLLSHYARRSTITARVGEFIPATPESDVTQGSVTGAALRRTEAALHGRSWWPAFVEDVDIARMGRSPTELAYLAAIGSIVAAALLILLTGSPLLGLPALLIGPFTLRAVVNMRVRKQRTLFEDQLASNLEEVASAVRSGRSIVEALAIVSGATEEPTRTEFERALANERLGRPLEETLRPIAHRMRSEGMEQVAVVAAMHRQTGSSVAEALDRVSEGTRERAELQRELRALTAQGRLARWILTALPPVLLLAFTIIDSRYERPMYHTTGGLLALGIGAVMVVAGSLVMKRIVDIEV